MCLLLWTLACPIHKIAGLQLPFSWHTQHIPELRNILTTAVLGSICPVFNILVILASEITLLIMFFNLI